jgi:probable O-glycosylation ligase (exosortase A-associated)
MWTWIAYFNPHRYGWGVAYNFPAALVVAAPTLVGMLFTRQRNHRILVREAVLLLVLWGWFVVTTAHTAQVPQFTGHMADCLDQFTLVSKILLMTFVTVILVTSEKRLKYLLLVTALSLGVRAVAGALFGLATGGEFRVYGPPDSFIEDNNAFGLALNMCLPLLFFLARQEKVRSLRIVLWSGFYCGIVCVLLTYSRGGLLGLAAVLSIIAIKARRKTLGILCFSLFVFVVIVFAPAQWMTRMDTFLHGKLDESAEQRLVSWGFAWNFVHTYPVTGGGFEVFPDVALFQQYQPRPLPGGAASTGPHSIYFQMLGEHGFIGLALFLTLLGSSLLSLRLLRWRARRVESVRWAIPYSHMLEVGLIGYMVSGATLGLAYFDLSYLFLGCVIILKVLCRQTSAVRLTNSKEDSEFIPESTESMEVIGRQGVEVWGAGGLV